MTDENGRQLFIDAYNRQSMTTFIRLLYNLENISVWLVSVLYFTPKLPLAFINVMIVRIYNT